MSYLVSTSRGLQIVMLNHVSQFVHTLFFNFSGCIFLIKYLYYLLMFIVKNKFKAHTHKHTHFQPIQLNSPGFNIMIDLYLNIYTYWQLFLFWKRIFHCKYQSSNCALYYEWHIVPYILGKIFLFKINIKIQIKMSNCCIKD